MSLLLGAEPGRSRKPSNAAGKTSIFLNVKRQFTRVSSYAILLREERILLCRLSSEVAAAVGKWTLPGGGIEFGESPEAAVVREVYEETGYEIDWPTLTKIDSELFEFKDRWMHALRILYRAEIIGGELHHEPYGSTDRAEWFSRAECEELPLVEVARVAVKIAFG